MANTPKKQLLYPNTTTKGFTLRDFSRGRITSYSVNSLLVPVNSVSNGINVNFDTIIGSGVVRPGTTLLGSTVLANATPLGLSSFVAQGGSPNLSISVFNGASNATLYYYNGSWNTSQLTTINNTAYNRFAVLGNRIFKVNGVDFMLSSSDGNVWNNTDTATVGGNGAFGVAATPITPSLILAAKQTMFLAGDPNSPDRLYFSSPIYPTPNGSQFAISGITRSSTTATVTTVDPHGYQIGEYVNVYGANQTAYNGTFVIINVPTTQEFQYTVVGTPTTPATGTMTTQPSQLSYYTLPVGGTAAPVLTQEGAGWVDINPDDGQNISALTQTSNQIIVFKPNAMYRFDAVNNTVDTQNIFNIGAISQEATTTCQGIVYFYSGLGIFSTDGTYPTQISRLGVQDFIDAIPVANQSKVCSGNDTWNVYFSIGNITLNQNKNGQRTYKNVVLKYSTRDQSWSAHSYAQQPLFYSQYTSSTNGLKMISTDSTGSVQTVNLGFTDNGSPISYFLDTQEQEFGNRANTNDFSNLIAVFCKNGTGSSLQFKTDDEDFKQIGDSFMDRVNIIDDFDARGHYFTFRWLGVTSTSSPTFEGLYIDKATDEGMVYEASQ